MTMDKVMDKTMTPEQQAEELLPCQWSTRLCDPKVEELCYGCQHRPAVAAIIAQLRSQLAVAQGMRAKAEWKLNHDHTNHKWVYLDGTPVPIGKCIDERHDWIDEMWIAHAERKG